MILSEVSVRRPVLATVMSLLLVLVGVMSYQSLSVREYPSIDSPVLSVRTVYRGASAEIVESQVTKPLEDSIAGIEGIRTMKSVSREEVSEITVEFNLDRDPDSGANDVRDRVARVRGRLPTEAEDPVVAKVEADAQPVIWLAFYSDRHTPLEITDFADRTVKDRLQTLSGVASVIIGGERRYAMRVWLDRDRLNGFRLVPQDVEAALRAQNVEIPSGRLESTDREFTVLTQTDLRTPDDFNNVIIREVNGYLVRLKDVGVAEIGAADDRNALRVNGVPAVGLGVVKQSTANTLGVAQAVKAALPDIEESLPEGMNIRIGFDSSVFIEESIKAVYETIVEALILVVLVIFVFLRSLRATLIPFVTIPVSLIGAFIFMSLLGYSINILTLLALVLAIGLVVDDAIVMLENIYRRIESGMAPVKAALEGSREIGFAIIAMTTTLAAVFLPLGFMSGKTGKLFTEFAWTVSAAVLVSGFVALSLTPMMCSKLLRPSRAAAGVQASGHAAPRGRFRGGYERLLNALLTSWRAPFLVVVILALVGAGIYAVLGLLKSELSPVEDRGSVIGIMLSPEGATMEYTDRYARQIEEFYSTIPEVKTYFMVVAPGLQRPNPVTMAMSFIMLNPWDDRERSQQQIIEELRPKMGSLPGVMAFPSARPSLGQGIREKPLQFVIQAGSYKELDEISNRFLAKMREYPGVSTPDSDLKLNKPQISITVDRDKAADLGVPIADIGRTLETLLGGREVTQFRQAGQQYDVIVQLRDDERTTPEDLAAIYVRGSGGNLVPLLSLIQYRETVAPKELNHYNRLRAATLSAVLTPTATLGEALEFVDRTAREILPEGATLVYDGQSRDFKESGSEMFLVFALALAFIFLVLAAQFESFVDPLIILITVPLASLGALAALLWAGGTWNVYSQIGMVMLVGLITKNGILIVEFANQLQAAGKDKIAAVVEASSLRLRPIAMTTLTMVLAALPLAFAAGAGAEPRQQIGWVIVGGLLFGTIMTLIVIPAAYVVIARKRSAAAPVEEGQLAMAS